MPEKNVQLNSSLSRRKRLCLFAITALVLIYAVLVIMRGSWNPFATSLTRLAPLQMSFDGETTELKGTQVVPTLDTPMQKGKNVIWCASFQLAWKELEKLAGGPVQLEGAETVCKRLNDAPDPTTDLPEGSFYATFGWEDKGIIQTIQNEMKKRFPEGPRRRFQTL